MLTAFIVMRYQGVNANIMSLGGIAIAIGAMVDAAIVMIENAHKHLEAWRHDASAAATARRRQSDGESIADAAAEVGPALFFSLLVITLSFVPVFALEAQEGRLFAPLAFTKTYAMAAAAGLSVTLVPVLMGYLIRGRIPDRAGQSVEPRADRALPAAARAACCASPKAHARRRRACCLPRRAWPATRLGGEFMPPLDEGDLLYMPTALPGLSPGKAAEILQQTDRLIATVPEVSACSARSAAPRRRPIRRRWRWSRPRSSSSRASSGGRA